MKSSLDKVREAPQSTKARILQAAQEVFAEKGFEGASTREIAARAGVNISSLHYHWESKETLYYAIFESIYEQLVDRLRESVGEPKSSADLRAMIERTMGLTFDFFAENRNIPRLLLRRMLERDAVDLKTEREAMGPAWRTFAEWVREHTGGRLAASDATFFMLTVQCVLMVLMLDTPHVHSMLGGDVADAEIRERCRRQVIHLVETLIGVGA